MENNQQFNITTLFYDACKKYPERLAIIDKQSTISYSQLAQEVHNTIHYFKEKGIQKGDRILVFVSMGIDLYRIVLAIFSMGAIAVFVDEWVSIKRLSQCCNMASCKAFIASKPIRCLGFFIREIRSIPIFLSHTKQLQTSNTPTPSSTLITDTALITFTTGSTGIPKAIERSHGYLQAQFNELHPLLQGSISISMLPIVLLIQLGLGITSVIPSSQQTRFRKFNVKKILDQLEQYHVDSIIASPFYLLQLAEAKYTSNTLKHLISGGAPIYLSDAETIRHAFSTATFTLVYGSSEVEPISYCDAEESIANKQELGLYTGQPVPTLSVKIIPLLSPHISSESMLNDQALVSGEIGEIIVSGNAVNKTYLNNPSAVMENKIITEKNVWHRTGDSGYINNRGQLFLTGRVAQIIHHKQKTYYPFVIENKLKTIQGVIGGTLIAWNNKLYLIICKTANFNQADLSEFDFDELHVVKQLPYDPRHHSKIDYAQLTKDISLKRRP